MRINTFVNEMQLKGSYSFGLYTPAEVGVQVVFADTSLRRPSWTATSEGTVIYKIEVENGVTTWERIESVEDATSLYLRGVIPIECYKKYLELNDASDS